MEPSVNGLKNTKKMKSVTDTVLHSCHSAQEAYTQKKPIPKLSPQWKSFSKNALAQEMECLQRFLIPGMLKFSPAWTEVKKPMKNSKRS